MKTNKQKKNEKPSNNQKPNKKNKNQKIEIKKQIKQESTSIIQFSKHKMETKKIKTIHIFDL